MQWLKKNKTKKTVSFKVNIKLSKISYSESSTGCILLSGLTANIACALYVDILCLRTKKHTHTLKRKRAAVSSLNWCRAILQTEFVMASSSLLSASLFNRVRIQKHNENTAACRLCMCVQTDHEWAEQKQKTGRILAWQLADAASDSVQLEF